MSIKRFRVKTAAVAALAVLSVGGMAAAASGLAPASAGRAAPSAASTPGAQLAHARGDAAEAITTHGPPAAAARDTQVSAKPGDHATGPDASGAARDGLCQAWRAGEGAAHGRPMDAVAFQALAAAAGGADQVPAFCQADTDASAEPGRRQTAPPSRAPKTPPPASRPVERPDQGNGQGGPPTTSRHAFL
jgi:hypothetical protein